MRSTTSKSSVTESADFHTYYRFVDQAEWKDFWSRWAASKKPDKRGSLQLVATPLGDFIEVRHGSANQQLCLNSERYVPPETIKLAAELIRVEYYVRRNDLDSLVGEFKKSESAIQQVMTRVPQSDRLVSFDTFSQVQHMARAVSAEKAALAAIAELGLSTDPPSC